MTKQFDWLADFRRSLADTALIYLASFRALEEPQRTRLLAYIVDRTFYYANTGMRERCWITRQVNEDVETDYPQLDARELTEWAVYQVLNRMGS